jgi:hypothetical protein
MKRAKKSYRKMDYQSMMNKFQAKHMMQGGMHHHDLMQAMDTPYAAYY